MWAGFYISRRDAEVKRECYEASVFDSIEESKAKSAKLAFNKKPLRVLKDSLANNSKRLSRSALSSSLRLCVI